MITWLVWSTEQKEKLSEMEHQLKRAEAAQRRRIQNEKAARESEVCTFHLLHILVCLLLYVFCDNFYLKESMFKFTEGWII